MATIRKPFDHKETEGILFDEPSLAQQQFLDECDINNIMAHYRNTGSFGDVDGARMPSFGDFTALPEDYLAAQNLIIEAGEAFDTLPSATRKLFSNSPYDLLYFLADKNNFDRAVELGLIEKPISSDLVEPVPVSPDPSAE